MADNIDILTDKITELINAIADNTQKVDKQATATQNQIKEENKRADKQRKREAAQRAGKRKRDAIDKMKGSEDRVMDTSGTGRYSSTRKQYNQDKRDYNAMRKKYGDNSRITQRAKKKMNSSRSALDRERRIATGQSKGFDRINSKLSAKGGGNLKAGIAGFVGEAIGQVVNLATDLYIAQQKKELNTWKAQQEVYLKTLDTGGKLFNRKMEAFGKGMEGALSASFSGITEGVQEGAYSAANTAIDMSSTVYGNLLQDQSDLLTMVNANALTIQKANLENLKLTNEQISAGANALSSVVGVLGPWGALAGGLISAAASAYTKMSEATAEIDFQKAELEYKKIEEELRVVNEAKKTATDIVHSAVHSVTSFTNSIESISLKTDAAAKSMAHMLGMSSNNISKYENFIYRTAANLSLNDGRGNTIYFDKTPEDLARSQSEYIDASERNITLSQSDHLKNIMLGTVLGDEQLATSLLGSMDYFNQSVETGTDLIYEMYQAANKAGVSNRKFAKDLQQNLKLAQKYNFQDGVRGMMRMSVWAQQVRFNMQALPSMIDAIQNGGLEGVITQSAKLQVLGGKMAMGANPLSMAFEAWNDPESLAKRFNEMTSDVGYFDSATGQAVVQGADAMRLKAFAEAANMSYEDARAQVTQRIKGSQIDKALGANSGYTAEQKALLYSKAQLNQKTGQWEVTLDNGNRVENIANLTNDDFAQLMPTEEAIEEYVRGIYDWTRQLNGAQVHGVQTLASETKENLFENVNARINEAVSFVDNNLPTLKGMIEKSSNFATESFETQHANMIKYAGIFDDGFKFIKLSSQSVADALQDGSSKIRKAFDAALKDLIDPNNPDNNKELLGGIVSEADERKEEVKNSQYKGVWDWFLDESNLNNISEVYQKLMDLQQAKANQEITPEQYLNYAKGIFATGYDDLLDALAAKGLITDDDANNLTTEIVNGIIAQMPENFQWGNFTYGRTGDVQLKADNSYRDGTMSAQGLPMFTAAKNITPIHDGGVQLAASDPLDHALFAKVGGPFDILFNGVFEKVEAIYDFLRDGTPIEPRNDEDIDPLRKLYDSFSDPNRYRTIADQMRLQEYGRITGVDPREMRYPTEVLAPRTVSPSEWSGGNSNQGGQISFNQPLKIEIGGKIELGMNGQSLDITKEIANNPQFIRQLTQLISEGISRNMNGGKTAYTGGQLVGGLGFAGS